MKNELDQLEDDIAQQVQQGITQQVGGVTTPPPERSTIVENGKVKREWMVGDPWTDDYFFKTPD